jgi:hypothetical protein
MLLIGIAPGVYPPWRVRPDAFYREWRQPLILFLTLRFKRSAGVFSPAALHLTFSYLAPPFMTAALLCGDGAGLCQRPGLYFVALASCRRFGFSAEFTRRGEPLSGTDTPGCVQLTFLPVVQTVLVTLSGFCKRPAVLAFSFVLSGLLDGTMARLPIYHLL